MDQSPLTILYIFILIMWLDETAFLKDLTILPTTCNSQIKIPLFSVVPYFKEHMKWYFMLQNENVIMPKVNRPEHPESNSGAHDTS